MLSRAAILAALTKNALLELAGAFEIGRLSGKNKPEIVSALAKAARQMPTGGLLAALSRAELKTICRAAGLDHSGRAKQPIADRILAATKRARAERAPVRAAAAKKKNAGASTKAKGKSKKRAVDQYAHADQKRPNNPPVGLVDAQTDPDRGERREYAYDPHLDPQLVWAGKAERTSFEVPTVSLHVHERIDPKTIVAAVRARNGTGGSGQKGLFEQPEENPPLRDAVEFYRHAHNWSNRLIAGDSLLVMNSLLEKEGLGGQVQMIYIDPPYGIRYGSNFQPFVNKRDVKDGKDEDLTQEPETLKAFRDTWELGIHSYLSYLRDRLLLARELLHESGSCFVQISDENLHHVRELMDEVFGPENAASLITFVKTTSSSGKRLSTIGDFLLWYARDLTRMRYRQLYFPKEVGGEGGTQYTWAELPDGTRMNFGSVERLRADAPDGARVFRQDNLTSQRPAGEGDVREFIFDGSCYTPGKGTFKTDGKGLNSLANAKRLVGVGKTLSYVRYLDDFPVFPVSNIWHDTVTSGFAAAKAYVVQTNPLVLQRLLLMSTDPGDLVFDPTCGSGTTAYVAEQWGRRWITCDTSRVAITLAKQRLMTPVFDYYTLAHPEQGVGSGFVYKTVPHVTLKSIANNPDIKEGMTREAIDRAIAKHAPQETLYDQPEKDKSKARVTGPFTVEAVPAAGFGQPEVRPPIAWEDQKALPGMAPAGFLQPDASIAREGETRRQSQWRAELLATGIRAKAGASIEFVRLEPLPATRYLHADGETKEDPPRRAVISFGSEFAPLEQRQVEHAIDEARKLVPRPALVIFAALQFDPEAAKDIDETDWPGVTLLKAQMNGDLVTDDLKKKRSSNESFWLMGQPDVELRRLHRGQHAGLWEVEVHGFDYYDPRKGVVVSGGSGNIAVWLLDPDYDGRSLYPRQVFFPMAGPKDGWARLAKNLKAEIDPELIEQYRGTVSLPFEGGEHGRVAVKIVDDRGIESLRILALPE